MKFPKCSLIISTYNWPEALELVLRSCINQSVKPFEIIIADDGSTKTTELCISNFKKDHPSVNIVHIWHKDEGHQKCTILNKSIAKAQGDYIVQTDGDCILHKHFISDHIRLAKEGQFICGNRVDLHERTTHLFLQKKLRPSFLSKLLGSKIHFKYQFRNALLSQKKSAYISIIPNNVVRGCNMSFWKKDILEINGYDENFSGWGPEDLELATRLIHSDKTLYRVKHACIMYHLYHKELTRNMLDENNVILYNTRKNRSKYTSNGLNKWL